MDKGDLVIGYIHREQAVEAHIGYLCHYSVEGGWYCVNCYDRDMGIMGVICCDEVKKAVVVPEDYITELEN